jgi:hypothetical protein
MLLETIRNNYPLHITWLQAIAKVKDSLHVPYAIVTPGFKG